MALFGPKDKNLPLLTTFFQVEDIPAQFDDIEEVELFQWLVQEKHGNSRPPLILGEHDCFMRLARLHNLTKPFMIDLYDRRRLSASVATQFGILCRQIPQPQSTRTFGFPKDAVERDEEGEWINPKDVDIGRGGGLPYDYHVASKIVEDLIGIMRKPENLAKCPECQSIYVKARPASRQIYCSHRCGQRHLMRGKMREKRAAKKAVALSV